jgi:hypothetical protein
MVLPVECECGEIIPVELVSEDDVCVAVGRPWTGHGHHPGRVTFMCPCGSRHVTGPEVYPDWRAAEKLLRKWWGEHKEHVRGNVAN